MKKLIVSMLAMLALAVVCASQAFASDADSIYSTCSMYSAPGGSVVATLYAGSGCYIDELRGDWTAIITIDPMGNHFDGWVKTANLTNAGHGYRSYTPTYTNYYPPQAVPSGNAHTVLTATLHSGPNEGTPTVGTVPINVPVTVVADCGNGWVEINYNGAYGYVGKSAIGYYSNYSGVAVG